MTDNTYTLLMQLGPSKDKTLSVQGEEFVLGRDPESDWAIKDVEVSRGHARLIAREGGYAIEDLGSTNGTFVNGQRIRSVLQLDPGSTIRLGENVLLFYDISVEAKSFEDTQDENVIAEEEIPQVELLESVEREKASPPPAKAQTPAPGEAVPLSTVRENLPAEIPFYRRPTVIAVAVILLLGSFALSAFLWYVDANPRDCRQPGKPDTTEAKTQGKTHSGEPRKGKTQGENPDTHLEIEVENPDRKPRKIENPENPDTHLFGRRNFTKSPGGQIRF